MFYGINIYYGIYLTPEKSAMIGGNCMTLNLLYKKGTVKPTMNPPKTLVLNCVHPRTLPNRDVSKPNLELPAKLHILPA